MVFMLNISFSPYKVEYEQRMGFPKSSREVFLTYTLQYSQLPQTKLMFSNQQKLFQQERLFNEYIATVIHIRGNC